MTTEEFLRDVCPNHTDTSKWNKSELLHILELHTEQLRKHAVISSLLSDVDYWRQRCLLAEKCLEESPCDPDITSDQIKAWNAYHKFISWAGNDR